MMLARDLEGEKRRRGTEKKDEDEDEDDAMTMAMICVAKRRKKRTSKRRQKNVLSKRDAQGEKVYNRGGNLTGDYDERKGGKM